MIYAHQDLAFELQKIYLFATEGCSQDRGRPRPPSTSAGSPAKRAKLGDDEQEEEQHTTTGESEEEQHQQTEGTEANETAAERSATSKPVALGVQFDSTHCLLFHLTSKAHRREACMPGELHHRYHHRCRAA